MVENTKIGQQLSQLLENGPLQESLVLSILDQLVRLLADLHQSGLIHRALDSDSVSVDEEMHVRLAPPSHKPVLVDLENNFGRTPPDFSGPGEVQLPALIDAARKTLADASVSADPRRIDIYQIGCLTLRLLTGEAPSAYLMSPQAKQKIPEKWKPFLDRALGYEDSTRISDCEQLQALLKQLSSSNQIEETTETPPAGTGLDVHSYTPSLGHRKQQPPHESPAALQTPDADLPFHKLGHFRIEARLGSGGMGDVYRAYDPDLDRTVAIKVLPHELARHKDFVARFTSEARAAGRLVHPNVVHIHSIGEDQGHHFFAMQFVPGESLASLLKRRNSLTVPEALSIIRDVTQGLAAAHGTGLIHRDIKPGNV
ncbi:MAG: protein kinase, partial [Pirellulales bacterium]|nr:protein kinase [Pirellulales bacterium]